MQFTTLKVSCTACIGDKIQNLHLHLDLDQTKRQKHWVIFQDIYPSGPTCFWSCLVVVIASSEGSAVRYESDQTKMKNCPKCALIKVLHNKSDNPCHRMAKDGLDQFHVEKSSRCGQAI